MLQVNLLIMVDGVHHFKDSYHGRTVEQQRASDQRFDIAVLAEDRRCASSWIMDTAGQAAFPRVDTRRAVPVTLPRAAQRCRTVVISSPDGAARAPLTSSFARLRLPISLAVM